LAANHAAQGDLQLADAGGVIRGAGQLLPEHADLRTSRRTSERSTRRPDARQRGAQYRTTYAAQEALGPAKNATTYGGAAGLDELARGGATPSYLQPSLLPT
jgi:hypothetical protein